MRVASIMPVWFDKIKAIQKQIDQERDEIAGRILQPEGVGRGQRRFLRKIYNPHTLIFPHFEIT